MSPIPAVPPSNRTTRSFMAFLPSVCAPARLAGEVVVERPREDDRGEPGAALPHARQAGGQSDHERPAHNDRKIDQGGRDAAVIELRPACGHGGCVSDGIHLHMHRQSPRPSLSLHWHAGRAARAHLCGPNGDSSPHMERVAIVDMGSNSWRLVIYGYEPGTPWWSMVDEIREAVRVGAGMGEERRLQPERIDRALHTAAVFASFCRASEIERGGGRGHERHPRRRQLATSCSPRSASRRASSRA